MLNLFVMRLLLLVSFVINFLTGWFSLKTQLDLVRILSPQKGDVLQGNIDIIGTATGIGFQYAEISFRYQKDVPSEWFLISQISEPKVDDFLLTWDTSSIVDGNYQLRIQAFYLDGHHIEAIIEDLRIRNYSPVETIVATNVSPSSLLSTEQPSQAMTSTKEILEYATPLPKNELTVEIGDISNSAFQGSVIGVLILIVIGLWLILRERKIG
ncbi:MAG: hypothetical protein ACYDH1_04235 [Anaerolineaceae bacterium]